MQRDMLMLQEIIRAFTLIFIAEMGDKTQILAMAFATRFPVKKVIFGIFIGSLLNHGLAVALGRYISNYIPVNTIQIIAGFAFVGFSLWTLKSEDEEEESEGRKDKFGPVLTVALAFFLGELGDKTQLTAITLATDALYPLAILMGTVLGMIATGGIGIIIGRKLGNKIPEFAIKIIAASVFMFFGLTKLYETLPNKYLKTEYIIGFVLILSIIVFMQLKVLIIKRRKGIKSKYMVKSKELYDYYNHMKKDMNNICLGLDNCKICQGNRCIIGFAKEIIKNKLNGVDLLDEENYVLNRTAMNKDFNTEDVIDSLVDTLFLLKLHPKSDNSIEVHKIRQQLELILFKKSIRNMVGIKKYKSDLEKINKELAEKIFNKLEERINHS